MSEFSGSQLALRNMMQEDPIQKKIAMDALRKRIAGEPDKKKELREACQGFEAIFIQKVWEQMRKNVPKEGYLHSKDEEIYQSMFDQELAKKMSSAGGIGLADIMYDQLSQKLWESSRTTAPSRMTRDPNLGVLQRPFVVAAKEGRNLVQPLPQKAVSENMANIGNIYQPFTYPDEAHSPARGAAARDGVQDSVKTAEAALPDAEKPLESLERVPDSQAEVIRYFDALEQSVRAEAARRAAARNDVSSEAAARQAVLAGQMPQAMPATAGPVQNASEESAGPSVAAAGTRPEAPVSLATQSAVSSASPAVIAADDSSRIPTPEMHMAAGDEQVAGQRFVFNASGAMLGPQENLTVAPGNAASEGVPATFIERAANASENSSGLKTPVRNVGFSNDGVLRTREFGGPSLEEQRALAAVALAEKMKTRRS